ncbi:MAG: hypothetical protein ACE5J1_04760, partial [Nitrospiria bacterium]
SLTLNWEPQLPENNQQEAYRFYRRERMAATTKFEGQIKKLKMQIGKMDEGGQGSPERRELRKRLKRAQRRKRRLTARAAFIEAKGQKKEKGDTLGGKGGA